MLVYQRVALINIENTMIEHHHFSSVNQRELGYVRRYVPDALLESGDPMAARFSSVPSWSV